jgi:uncharacterized protein YigA (DUF484 family)
MAQPDVEGMVSAWQQGYESLSRLSMEQLVLAKKFPKEVEEEVEAELWENLQKLTVEKQSLQKQIERIQADLLSKLGREEMVRRFQQGINVSAESARVLTFEASRKIEQLMISVGQQLGSTKSQRKVFNAYYGMNSDDQIAYYFDEKK